MPGTASGPGDGARGWSQGMEPGDGAQGEERTAGGEAAFNMKR